MREERVVVANRWDPSQRESWNGGEKDWGVGMAMTGGGVGGELEKIPSWRWGVEDDSVEICNGRKEAMVRKKGVIVWLAGAGRQITDGGRD